VKSRGLELLIDAVHGMKESNHPRVALEYMVAALYPNPWLKRFIVLVIQIFGLRAF